MRKKVKKYDESLIESLKDPKEAVAYLNAHLEDDAKGSEELFLLALRDVAKAHGFGDVAKGADLGRESLYKALSADGNPEFTTIMKVMRALGVRLRAESVSSRSLSGLRNP